SEGGERHRVETLADAGITGSKFARFLERDLLPKTREMQNAKWARNAGTDQWNICVSHSNRFGNPTISELQVPTESEASPVGGALSHAHIEQSCSHDAVRPPGAHGFRWRNAPQGRGYSLRITKESPQPKSLLIGTDPHTSLSPGSAPALPLLRRAFA